MYLLSQLWLTLLLATALGFLVGWTVYRACFQRDETPLWQTKVSDLERYLSSARAEAGQHASKANALASEVGGLRKSMQDQSHDWSARLAGLESDLASARAATAATADDWRLKVDKLTAELASARAATQAQGDDMGARIRKLELELTGAKNANSEWESKFKRAESDHSTARSAAQEWEGKVAKLQAELLAANATTTEWRTKHESLTGDFTTAQSSTKDLTGKVAALTAELSAAKGLVSQWEGKHNTIQQELEKLRVAYKAEADSNTGRLEGLQRDLEVARGQHTALAADHKRSADEWSSKIKNAEHELGTLRSSSGEWKSKHDVLEREFGSVRTRIGALEGELTTVRADASSQSARAQTLTNELNAARSLTAEWETKHKKAVADLDECRRRSEVDRTDWLGKFSSMEADLAKAKEVPKPMSNADFKPSASASMSVADLEREVSLAGDGVRPKGILPDTPDDLREIGGVGPVNEEWLHKQGIYYFWQIASWSPSEAAWISKHLPNFGGRVYRENWMSQAAKLARGEITDAKSKYLSGEHT